MTTFNEFLNADIEDFKMIFNFYVDFLSELSGKNFPFEEQIKLKGAGGKFLSAVDRISYIRSPQKDEYLQLIDEVLRESSNYRRYEDKTAIYKFIIGNRSKRMLLQLQDTFQILYSSTLDLINETTNKTAYFDELKLNDFFKPENSNKSRIKDLINEAINLIRSDDTLTEKSKKSIIDYLEKALRELETKHVNWTRFLGRIKETVIVLGALGSFIGGGGVLYSAQEKLEQTTEIIQKTSVNINYTVLNETFNIQYIEDLVSINRLLELPLKTEPNMDAELLNEKVPNQI